MNTKEYVSLTVFGVLVIWEPFNAIWPSWLLGPGGYFFVLPLLLLFILLSMDSYLNIKSRLSNWIFIVVSFFNMSTLLFLAYQAYIEKYHYANTRYVWTRDGNEAVGHDLRVPGPDYGVILIYLLVFAFILWYGVVDKYLKIRKEDNRVR